METNKRRPAEEILEELCNEVIAYNSERDSEWDFGDEHGFDPSFWTEDDEVEHGEILDAILTRRVKIRGLLREALGRENIDF